MHLSFEGVMLAEIPCYDIIPPEGYYATTNYTNSLSPTNAPSSFGTETEQTFALPPVSA